MGDMAKVIIPKSDQLNADDLIAGPRTIRITGVTIRGGQEQPIAISFEGDDGKPYKACKSMCRVMVTAWGADSSKYTGRSMTLFREPTVKWGGMEVGGIRISHMSDIDSAITLALTMTRANKKPFTVKPLAKESAAPASKEAAGSGPANPESEPGQADYVSADQAVELGDLCTQSGVNKEKFLAHAGAASFAKMLKADYADAKTFFLSKIQ